MIYVIFIMILIVASERRIGGIALISPLVPQAMFNVSAAWWIKDCYNFYRDIIFIENVADYGES